MLAVKYHTLTQVRRDSWACASVFLIAFCWLGFAAVRFGSIFQGMGMEQNLPPANWFAVTCGPIAFPIFGVVAAAAFILVDVLFRNRWMQWTLIAVFALLIIWGFRALIFGGVFMVPTARANNSVERTEASRFRDLQFERQWRLASAAHAGR